MNIQEATKLALEKDLYITRVRADVFKNIRIKPSNSSECCISYVSQEYEEEIGRKVAPGIRWQPKAEDLIANDWIVTELDS